MALRPITLSAVISEDHHLSIELPDDSLVGEVKLVIYPAEPTNSGREAARAKLAAAGLLGQAHLLPAGIYEPTEEELLAAGTLPPGARPTHELIAEDRDER
jgi:hypothetical protein